MEKSKYKKLLNEVFSLMRGELLDAALAQVKSAARVDAVQDLMRNAIMRSSISKFNGTPYYFSGRIYEEMSWDDFGNLVYDLMRKCALPDGDYSRVEGVLKVCRRVVSGKQLRPNNAVMVFANGVFDMESRMFHDFDKRWVQTTEVPYVYDPAEHVHLWKMFLEQVLPNEEVRMVLQEFLGSIFVNRNDAKMETMMILRGSGSNGKSVVFETVMGILGRENVSNFGIGSLITGSERKKNIAFINGKRLNYCSEIQAFEIGRDSDILKSLISGEPTEARPLYGDNFTAYNIPMLMANANHMPYLRDWSYGMRRRICILPFDVEIPVARQRKELARDLEHEYPAIFNWILEGRDRFIANGYKLSACKELEEVMNEYQSESSTVMQFMYQMGYECRFQDVADIEPKWVMSATLYKQYVRWCRENDIKEETVTRFGMIITSSGYQKRRFPKGQAYGIFGKVNIDMLVYQRKKARKKATETYKMSKVFLNNGRRFVYTVEGLCAAVGIGTTVGTRAYHEGKLDGLWHKEGRTTVFDLDGVLKRARETGMFKTARKTKKEKDEDAKRTLLRKQFNNRMAAMHLPFRKYKAANQAEEGIIHVPDNWEYTKENAVKKIREYNKAQQEKND